MSSVSAALDVQPFEKIPVVNYMCNCLSCTGNMAAFDMSLPEAVVSPGTEIN